LFELRVKPHAPFSLIPRMPLRLHSIAEILADQQKWLQAEKYASQAVAQAPDSMDTHRVYGYVLETLGQYNAAIQQYQEAAEINPNMTFLYIRIGVNFREGIPRLTARASNISTAPPASMNNSASKIQCHTRNRQNLRSTGTIFRCIHKRRKGAQP